MDELVKLVNSYAAYREKEGDLTVEAFCRRYVADMEVQQHPIQLSDQELSLEARLARAVGRLSRFAEIYSKKALSSLQVKNIDDFVYIGTIGHLGYPKKIEVIQAHMTEVTTGTAIIARLVEAGWVEEHPDANDARSKRIRLTASGTKLLQTASPEMRKVARTTFDALSDSEARTFLYIAEKLERIHTEMYSDCKNLEIEAIYQKMYGKGIPESISVSSDWGDGE